MATSLAAVFGRNVRARREQLGLTQAEVAREVGLAVEAYGRLERGYALPRATTLVALAKLLGTSTDALLGLRQTAVRPSLLDEVGAPKAGYRAASGTELRRLVSRLAKLRPREIRLLSRLVGLISVRRPSKY